MFKIILDDPIYFSIALTLAGLVGGALFSWIFTFVYFTKGQSKKLLCYTSRDSDYLGYQRADFENLSVKYGDRELTNPVRYTVYVWNCGNTTIHASDISTVDPLAFGKEDIEILELVPAWTTRDSINLKTIIDASKTKVFAEFEFLDPNDGFALQFLVDRRTNKNYWSKKLQAYGTVKGLSRAPFFVTAGFDRSSWWTPYLGFAAITFFAFSAVAIAYDAWVSGFQFSSLPKILAAVIFGVAAVGIATACLEGIGSRRFVIPSLLRKATNADDEVVDVLRGVGIPRSKFMEIGAENK